MSIIEEITNNQEIFIIFYCLLILYLNIDYLRDHKHIKKGLSELSDDEALDVNPNSMTTLFIVLSFNFIRRWLIYLLAIYMFNHILIILMASLLFLMSFYDALFNFSLAKIKQSNLGLYIVIVDTILISIFTIYLLFHLF